MNLQSPGYPRHLCDSKLASLASEHCNQFEFGNMSGRRGKGPEPLRASERSNGVAVNNPHTFASSSTSGSAKSPKRVLGAFVSHNHGNGNGPAGPRDRMTNSRISVEDSRKGDATSTKSTTKSRAPANGSPPWMQTDRIYLRRRNSASSASIKSFKSFTSVCSSITSRKRKLSDEPSLATMPREILDLIFQYLPQTDLLHVLRANTNLVEVAALHMYNEPKFVSTYRYAQFAWTVSHKEAYAQMVRILDLSHFSECPEGHGKPIPQAGWREFKYRHHDRYYPRGDKMAAMAATSLGPKLPNSSHPTPSPILKRYRRTRDLPIGGICHVLAACKNIRKVNFSHLQVAGDFVVQHESHPATAFTGLIFVSDVPKAFTWEDHELITMVYDEITDGLIGLQQLEVIKAKGFRWLSTAKVRSLMCNRSLKEVDFRDSGFEKNVRWNIKGTKVEVQKILRYTDADGKSVRSVKTTGSSS